MVSQHIIDIIIKAEDQLSNTLKKVQGSMDKMGNSSKKAMDTASQATEKFNQQMAKKSTLEQYKQALDKIGMTTSELKQKMADVTRHGGWNKLTADEQKAAMMLSQYETELDDVLQSTKQFSSQGMSGWNQLSSAQKRTISSIIDVQSKTSSLQSTHTSLGSVAGAVWDKIKSKISTTASSTKNTMGSALSWVKSKIESVGNAFSGLGGVISSVFGAIGMNSFKDMTLGLSLNREKVQSLTYAVYGTGNATDDLWDKMDALTTEGVNNLDGLAQAMNTIKMSTGASTAELTELMPVVNDIGQRAIMMGKQGEEAVGLMQAAGKGLNGEFSMLQDNFGITKDKLTDLGWSGAADDVTGYTEALQKYLDKGGSMDGLLQTTTGKLETFGKHMRIAGRNIGDKFTPFLDEALDKLNAMTKPTSDGSMHLGHYAIAVMGVGSAFATLAPSISPALQVMDFLAGKTKSALRFFGLMAAAEDAVTLKSTMLAIAEMFQTGATEGLTVANASLTASFWAMASAILANPLTWVVVALAAVAIAVYEVGKSFGWWTDVSSMLEAVWAGIQRLWQAFINNPNVKATIQDISNAWNDVCEALKPVIDWAGQVWKELFPPNASGEVDIVRMIIDTFGAAGDILGKIVNGAKSAWSELYKFSGVAGVILGPAALVYGALRSIVCILLGCSPGIVPALRKTWEVFQTVFNAISSFISGVVSTITGILSGIIQTLQPLYDFLANLFAPVWETIITVFRIVGNYVQHLMGIFGLFLSGQINLQTALSMIWNLLRATILKIFIAIINGVVQFSTNLVRNGIKAGKGLYDGVVNHAKNLPGKVWSYVTDTAGRITSGGSQWVNNARSKASAMVTGVTSQVSTLPGKVYTEFINIGSRMLSAGSSLVQKAKQIGGNIVKGLLDSMGIHSPGFIQKAVVKEFENTLDQVGSFSDDASLVAATVGENMVGGFSDFSLNAPTPEIPTMPVSADVSANMDISGASHGLQSVTDLTNDTNKTISNSYAQLSNNMGASLNTMVNTNRTSMTSIKTDSVGALNSVATVQKTQMANMNTNYQSSINNIVSKNKTGWGNVKSVTASSLTNMQNSTKRVTTSMKDAWGTMRDSIVNSAEKIKSGSTSRFDSLSNTIKGFYGKLQNPSRWGAAGGSGSVSTMRKVGTPGSGMNRISNILAKRVGRESKIPTYIPVSQAKANPYISASSIEFLTEDNDKSRIRTSDLLRSGALSLDKASSLSRAGFGWLDSVKPNLQSIKDRSNKWSMKGPKIMNTIDTGLAFKVKDFESGTPKIGLDDFTRIAFALVQSTNYGYYADSSRHGNWLNALRARDMNCSDGSDMLIALAHTMGLSAEKVHCYWGTSSSGIAGTSKGEGHFVARIGGKIFDSVSMRHGSLTSPKVHGYGTGPAPRTVESQKDDEPDVAALLMQLIEILNRDTTNDSPIQLNITVDGGIDVTVDGDTTHINTEEFANKVSDEVNATLKRKLSDKFTIESIISAIQKRNKKLNRMGGT